VSQDIDCYFKCFMAHSLDSDIIEGIAAAAGLELHSPWSRRLNEDHYHERDTPGHIAYTANSKHSESFGINVGPTMNEANRRSPPPDPFSWLHEEDPSDPLFAAQLDHLLETLPGPSGQVDLTQLELTEASGSSDTFIQNHIPDKDLVSRYIFAIP
jgi:hypothetical protein